MTGSSKLRERLAQNQVLAGLLQERPDPLLVEMAEEGGYDFLILDGQRGVFSGQQLIEALRSLIAAKKALAMVRLAGHVATALQQCVESGADAIIVPEVSTAEEASALVRTLGSGQDASLIVILESARGVANVEEILAVEGVDGAFVGPINLSTDLECPQDYAHTAYREALSRIEQAAASTGKILGTVPTETHPVEALIPRGHRLFILGSDRWLLQEAMNARATKIREFCDAHLRAL